MRIHNLEVMSQKHFILRRVPEGAETLITGELIAGRTPSCGLLLPEGPRTTGEPPRQSARLVVSRGVLWVEDLGSQNGTYVNGSRLPAGTMIALKGADRLRIDSVEFQVHDPAPGSAALAALAAQDAAKRPPEPKAASPAAARSAPPAAAAPDSTKKPPPPEPKLSAGPPLGARLAGASPEISRIDAPTPPANPEASPEKMMVDTGRITTRTTGGLVPSRTTDVPDTRGPMLRVLTGALAGKHFTLESLPGESCSWRIGRHSNQDIILPHVSVSGEHARIVNQGGRWEIIDQLSRGGTFVNGKHVMRSPLATGDRLLIGAIQCSFDFPGQILPGSALRGRFLDVPALIISMAVTSTVVLIIWRYLPALTAAMQHLWGRTG